MSEPGRPRIGLLADRLSRRRTTGVGTYAVGLAQGLARAGSDIDYCVCALPERDSPPSVFGGLPTSVVPLPRTAARLAWTVARRPPLNAVGGPLDLLHVLVPIGPVPTDLPLLVTIHDLMPIKHPDLFDRKTRLFFGAAMQQVRRRADHVVVVSEHTRRDVVALLDLPLDRLTVVPLGPPDDLEMGRERDGDVLAGYGLADIPFVLFVGEVSARKNPLGLLEAFVLVAAEFPKARLLFAGSPGLAAEALASRVAVLGLGDRVRLLGHIPRAELVALLRHATVLCLPSVDEGFGIPVLEAMAVGTAVLVSDGGSLPEVVGDAGLVVPGADVAGLAAGLRRLLGDPELRGEMVTRGLRRAEDFSWDAAARATLSVYRRMLDRPDRPTSRDPRGARPR